MRGDYQPRVRRTYTAEAIIVGFLIALLPGFLVGLAVGLLTVSWHLGVILGSGMFCLGLDILFRGR